MAKKRIRNWRPVVLAFLKTLQEHGFTLHSVNDGDEDGEHDLAGLDDTSARRKACDAIVSVDSCHLRVTRPERAKRMVVFLVLDTDPHDIACNYSDVPELEAAIDKFVGAWEGRKVPTKLVETAC